MKLDLLIELDQSFKTYFDNFNRNNGDESLKINLDCIISDYLNLKEDDETNEEELKLIEQHLSDLIHYKRSSEYLSSTEDLKLLYYRIVLELWPEENFSEKFIINELTDFEFFITNKMFHFFRGKKFKEFRNSLIINDNFGRPIVEKNCILFNYINIDKNKETDKFIINNDWFLKNIRNISLWALNKYDYSLILNSEAYELYLNNNFDFSENIISKDKIINLASKFSKKIIHILKDPDFYIPYKDKGYLLEGFVYRDIPLI